MPKPGSTIISNQTSSQRLLKFSGSISKCSAQSVAYAKCVVENSGSLKKDHCAKEFIEFKNCFKNAISKK